MRRPEGCRRLERHGLGRPVILTNQTEDDSIDGLAAIDYSLVKATCKAISHFIEVDDLCYEIYTFVAPSLQFGLDIIPDLEGGDDVLEEKNKTPWWIFIKVEDLHRQKNINIKFLGISKIIIRRNNMHTCPLEIGSTVNIFQNNQGSDFSIVCECGYSDNVCNDDVTLHLNVKDVTNPYFIQLGLFNTSCD